MARVSKASDVMRVRAGMGAAVQAAAVVVMMMAAVVGARPAKVNDIGCSTSDTYVYPYWSMCDAPAELSTGYPYLSVRTRLGLAPEYDETNATYYVRLADDAATYVAVTESSESGTLLVNSTVFIYNSETQRALTWREEGTDEYFLIEQEVSSIASEAARFRFLQADSVLLPCPLIYPPAQCQAYYLVSDGLAGASSSSTPSSSGLEGYEEDYVVYIKAASAGTTGNLPLLLTRSASSSSTSPMPFPKIRSVTARD